MYCNISKMRIYIGHASNFDYHNELYVPLKNSLLWQQHKFILPHEFSKEPVNSKKIICQCDLILAEVSYPSTGLGIELGWANSNNIPILGIYKKGRKISSSLQLVCQRLCEYSEINDISVLNFLK